MRVGGYVDIHSQGCPYHSRGDSLGTGGNERPAGVPLWWHTRLLGRNVSRVAVCGGAGSFLLPDAIRAGADAFVSADFKYHEFFDAEDRLVVADIGHFESEQYTIQLLFDIIREKYPTFALHLTEVRTNPVHYL